MRTETDRSPLERGEAQLRLMPKVVFVDAIRALPGLEKLSAQAIAELPGMPVPVVSSGAGVARYWQREDLVQWWRARHGATGGR